MTRLLLDVDTGIDDALALAYLASLPDVEFVAVTASPGNVDAHQVARNTLAMLELCGRTGVEVAVGAEGPLAIPLVTTPETHGPQGIGHAVLPSPSGTVSAAARRRPVGGGSTGQAGGADGPDYGAADELRAGHPA